MATEVIQRRPGLRRLKVLESLLSAGGWFDYGARSITRLKRDEPRQLLEVKGACHYVTFSAPNIPWRLWC